MWILVTEAMGALALLLFIVWWTLGPTHRREREALRQAALDRATGEHEDVDAKSSPRDSSS